MINSRFSNLVYRIIGKPEVIQEEYAEILNTALEEIDLFTDPSNFAEMEIGNQILSRIENPDNAIKALSALLDNGRFKIIILNDELRPIYNNKNAKNLLKQFVSTKDNHKLNTNLLTAIELSLNAKTKINHQTEELTPLNYFDQDGQPVYLKTVINQNGENDTQATNFQLLLVLDQSKQNPLNPQLLKKYQLTHKEQRVLINLIHGSSVKEIANNEFISENTVKTHLKSLFRKTNTKSQTQIVSLILSHESQILDSYFNNEIDTNLGLKQVPDQTIILKDHAITYKDYGPSDGDVLIVFHNGYGSRLAVPENYALICQRTNRRIIIIDRPGFGKTDYLKGHPNEWHLFMNEFIDRLKIESYDILGSVLSCPLAIKFASQADQRLKRIILSSPTFINSEEDSKYLLGILAPSWKIVKGSPRFAKQSYELWLKSITLNLDKDYRKMIVGGLGPAEQKLFNQDNSIESIINSFREATSKTLKGISNEMVFGLSPHNIDLAKITIPVDLWWGTEDVRFTREGVEKLAQQFPNSTLNIREGYSEHIYYALFEEIINTNN